MAKIVVLQPNGLYAVWSTIMDAFSQVNLTRCEVEKYLYDEARADFEARMQRQFKAQLAGTPDYDWEDTVKTMWHHHVQDGDMMDSWNFIAEHVDPSINEIVKSMVINDEGEWVSG